jgi:ribose/xylose/arabinose/galactoside ABC-type transport system permease subunit
VRITAYKGSLIKLPPFLSALNTVILARLLLIRFGSLKHFGALAVGTRLPPDVSGFAMKSTHVGFRTPVGNFPLLAKVRGFLRTETAVGPKIYSLGSHRHIVVRRFGGASERLLVERMSIPYGRRFVTKSRPGSLPAQRRCRSANRYLQESLTIFTSVIFM